MKLKESLGKVKKLFSAKKMFYDKKKEEQGQELMNIEKEIHQETQKIEIHNDGWSTQKMLRFWLVGLLVVALGFFGYKVLNLLFLIISAYIVSIILETFVSYFEKKGLKRSISLIISYFLFVVVLLGIIIIIIPFMINQISDLITLGTNYVSNLKTEISTKGIEEIIQTASHFPNMWKEPLINYISNNDILVQIQTLLQENLSGIISTGQSYLSHIGSWLISFFSGFASFAVDFLLFLTLCVLFSADKKNITNFLSRIGGKEKAKINKLKIEKVYKKLAVWLKARLLLSLFVAIGVWLVLIIMGRCGLEIPNKVGIALITGLLDIIPYIGPIFTAVLIFLVVILYNSFWVAVLSVLLLYVLNFVQENVLTPVLMKKALGISPVLIFVSMMLGGVIMGFMGILLSVPISAILVIFFSKSEHENMDYKSDENIDDNQVKEKKELIISQKDQDI